MSDCVLGMRSPSGFTMSGKDSVDAHEKPVAAERPKLESADVRQARHASGRTVAATEGLRTNASDGSFRDRTKLTAQQEESIQIMGAAGLAASRTSKLTEKDLAAKYPAARSIDIRELLAKPDKEAQALVEEFGRVTNMPAGLQRDAALIEVQQLADKTYGRGKYASKGSAEDLALNSSSRIEDYQYQVTRQENGKVKALETGVAYEVGKPSQLTEQNLLERIGALPLDQQAQVIGAAIKAFNGELTNQQFRIGVGAITGFGDGVVGLAEGAESLSKTIIGVAQFTRDVMTNDPAAIETAAKAGESLGKLMVGGVRVFSAANDYVESVGAATNVGDYGKPLRDVLWLGQQMNNRWESMSPEEKTRLVTKLAVENLGGMATGIGTNKIAKSIKITEALEAFGAEASTMGAGVHDKAKKLISKMADELLPQPMGLTPDGRLMPIPRETQEHVMFMKCDRGLPQGIKPSEQVSLAERINSLGFVRPEVVVPKSVYEAAAIQGFSREIVDQKLQIVAEALQKAFARVGKYDKLIHGTERTYGNQLHEQMRQNLVNIADKTIHPEASYLKNSPADWGKLGSSRVDISIGDKAKPFVSLCLKTLKATPSAQQERGWVKNLPSLADGSVPPRLYLKLPKSGE